MRIDPVSPIQATGTTGAIFAAVERHAGRVPNGLQVLAASPATLQAWWDFERALARSSLSRAQREQLAVLTAAVNGCEYCLVLHTAAADAAGPVDDEVTRAVLELARTSLASGGDVDDATLDRVRAAGLTDAHIVDVLAVVAINTLHNLCNRLARTPHDDR